MPRTARASVGGFFYHVINRGNQRARVFHSDADYRHFLGLMNRARARRQMRIVGYCLMPNHFHLLLWPYEDGDLSRWMQWLLTAHVRSYHRCYGTDGRVWQGRFKAFPIQEDEHLLTVLRYVERNALRANLVDKAEDWPWSSAAEGQHREWLPMALPSDWARILNEPQPRADLATIRQAVNRGRPLGTADWQQNTAARLGLESSLRPLGRPRKSAKK
jgi:putative transposase